MSGTIQLAKQNIKPNWENYKGQNIYVFYKNASMRKNHVNLLYQVLMHQQEIKHVCN